MEVLNMDTKSMDLARLNDGAPLLYQHDADRIVGVVQKAYIKDKRAYARVKLANNELGREMQDESVMGSFATSVLATRLTQWRPMSPLHQ
jgi:hypothetical protein